MRLFERPGASEAALNVPDPILHRGLKTIQAAAIEDDKCLLRFLSLGSFVRLLIRVTVKSARSVMQYRIGIR